MSTEFGDLIKAKLAERRMSQRFLAKMTLISPTHMNYLIRGINPRSASGKLRPSVSMVKDIARVLGIPLEEALLVAGHDPTIVLSPRFDSQGRTYDTEVKPNSAIAKAPNDDRPIFEIAYEAALAAIASRGDPEIAGRSGTVAHSAAIEIPGKMWITLFDLPAELTPDDIERYKRAFLAAYDSVRKGPAGTTLPS